MARTVIGVLVNEFDGSYQRELLEGLRIAAREYGVQLLCFPGSELATETGYGREFNMLYELAARVRLEGLISVSDSFVWTVGDEDVASFFARFSDLPVVSIGRGALGMPCVRADNRSGMAELVDHFILDHGFRRIAFISGPSNSQDARERLDVFVECHQRAGIEIDHRLILPGRFYHASGREAVECLVAAGMVPEAIIAANDEMALAAMSALLAHGLRVPEDVAMAGFDDLCAQFRHSPPLSSVRQDIGQQAAQGLRKLLDMIAGRAFEPESLHPTRAVLRYSCGCSGRRPEAAHGTLWENPGIVADDLVTLRSALQTLLREPAAQGVFRTTLQSVAARALRSKSEVNDLRNALMQLHRESLALDDVVSRLRASTELFEAQAWLSEAERIHLTDDLLERLFPHWILSYLLRMRLPAGESTPRTMLRFLREGIVALGVRNAYIVLYPQLAQMGGWRDCELPAEGQLVLAIRDGEILSTGDFDRFPIGELLPMPVFQQEGAAMYAVLPLFQQTDHYGYMVFDIERPLGVQIEPLREAISSLVTGTMVIGELARARDLMRVDLDRVQQNNQLLAILAEQDELTGLLNRRGFFVRAGGLELGRSEPLTLVTADMDGLKRINDAFGHAAGDTAIRDMALLLQSIFRNDDLVARLGGDEFVVLSRSFAPDVETRLRSRIEAKVSEYNATSHHGWRLGISLGFTVVPPDDTMDLAARLAIADRWLYDEKRRHTTQSAPSRPG